MARVATVGIAAAFLCWAVLATTVAHVRGAKGAAWTLAVAPWDAQTRASLAFSLLQDLRSEPARRRAEQLAIASVAREPGNVAGLRTLGLLAAARDQTGLARRYMALAEQLSRRDFATHLWWIEAEVGRGSVFGALHHFDEALRTSKAAADVLMPVLVNAVAEEPVARGLQPFLARRPSYFRQFFIQTSDSGPDYRYTAQLSQHLLNRNEADDRDLINRGINRFGRDHDFDAAARLFDWANRHQHLTPLVNGDLEHPNPFVLFNWDLTTNDSISGSVEANGEGNNALFLIAHVGGGDAARQLLRLPPGVYALSMTVGDVPAAAIDRPTVRIECAGPASGPVLAPVRFPGAATGKTHVRTRFVVGPGCAYQWLVFAGSASGQDETRAWVDGISITASP